MRKKKLDILMISKDWPPRGGGVATHVRYLVDGLSKLTRSRMDPARICRVHVVTASGTGFREGVPPNLIIHPSVGSSGHFESSGDLPFERPLEYLQQNWWKIDPDVIHVHDFESLFIGCLLKAAFRVPLLLSVHKAPKEWDAGQPQRDPKDAFLQAAQLFDLVDTVVTPSTAGLGRLISQGFAEEKVRRIPHGVPVEKLLSVRNNPTVLQRFALEEHHELVLCPARLDKHKAPDIFLEAAAILKESSVGANLIFAIAGAGDSDYRGVLEKRAVDLRVEAAVRFGPTDHGNVEPVDMPTLYRRARVCALPSRRDNFPQALLEAYVFGTPVVASNVGGIPDIVKYEDTGLLCLRDDAEDLAKQIRRLLEDREFASSLSKQARRKVERSFRAEEMAKAYFRLYSKVTGIKIQAK